jgi:CRISPR/Cas system endoribonuclease Cas6 (RAMP superfamily)
VESGGLSKKELVSVQTVATCLVWRLDKRRKMWRREVIQRRFQKTVGITSAMTLATVVSFFAAVSNRRYMQLFLTYTEALSVGWNRRYWLLFLKKKVFFLFPTKFNILRSFFADINILGTIYVTNKFLEIKHSL